MMKLTFPYFYSNIPMTADNKSKRLKVSPLAIMGSVAAASFGAQTHSNRERDFNQGKFYHFVIAGVVFTVLFIFILIGIVKVIIHLTGV